MIYTKDGKQSTCKHIELDGQLIFNPTAEQIALAGWVEYVEPTPTPLTIDEQNEQIKQVRQAEYERRSDDLYMAFQKYLAQGKTEKAEAMKQQWLDEIALIESENPYIVAE